MVIPSLDVWYRETKARGEFLTLEDWEIDRSSLESMKCALGPAAILLLRSLENNKRTKNYFIKAAHLPNVREFEKQKSSC